LGIETQGINISQTTEKGLMRLLMKRSGLAVWLDEFRNNTINRKHIEGFRNIYDRQPYVRAEKSNDLNIIEPKIVSCLMLSGEETPADQGLFSRCVVCLFSEKQRDNSLYEKLEQMASQFSNLTYLLLSNRSINVPKLLDIIEGFRLTLLKQVEDDRLALNYAIAAATAMGLLKHFQLPQQEIDGFRKWVIEEAIHNRELKESESLLNEFWDTIAVLRARGEIMGSSYFTTEGDRIYLWATGLYHQFETDYRRRKGESPFKYNVLLQQMKEEGYVLNTAYRKRLNGTQQRCIVLEREKIPENVQTIIESSLM
jgi:DNA primase